MNNKHWSVWIALTLLLAAVGVRADGEELALGRAYAKDSGALLYTELHRWQGVRHSVEYRQPDGQLFAVNDLDFSRDFVSPSYTQRYLLDPAQEGARWVDDKLVLFEGHREKTVRYRQPLVISSGFFHFIRGHWDELEAGKIIPFDFAMPARMETVALQMRRVSAGDSGIPDADPQWKYFRVELASKLFGWLVHPLNVAFDGQRRLVVYSGMSNVKDKHGDTPQVLIRYDYSAAATHLSQAAQSR